MTFLTSHLTSLLGKAGHVKSPEMGPIKCAELLRKVYRSVPQGGNNERQAALASTAGHSVFTSYMFIKSLGDYVYLGTTFTISGSLKEKPNPSPKKGLKAYFSLKNT